ncbi:MAG: hypothetical protein ACLTLQ_03515 [[Clostridium] scindens]
MDLPRKLTQSVPDDRVRFVRICGTEPGAESLYKAAAEIKEPGVSRC